MPSTSKSCHCCTTPPCFSEHTDILFQFYSTLDPLGYGYGGASETTSYGYSSNSVIQRSRIDPWGTDPRMAHPLFQSVSVRLATQPTGTCYLKLWLHTLETFSSFPPKNPVKTDLDPIEVRFPGSPCRKIGEEWKSISDIGDIIWGHEWAPWEYITNDPTVRTASWQVAIKKFSCVEGYEPSDPESSTMWSNVRPCPDPFPNGFPDDFGRPSRKGCMDFCDSLYDPLATCEGSGDSPCSGINNDMNCPPWEG